MGLEMPSSGPGFGRGALLAIIRVPHTKSREGQGLTRHRRVHMTDDREQKMRILVVGEDPSARDEIGDLLGSSGCDCTVASTIQHAHAAIDEREFDAVVLDAQSWTSLVDEVISRINKSQPNVLRRVVLITEDGGDPLLTALAEFYSFTRIQRKLLPQQLWRNLQSLLRREAVLQYTVQVARLISDSFREPLPAGVRSLEDRNRSLLYTSGNLMMELHVEARDGSDRIGLTGQILDSAKPSRTFEGIPVRAQGWKGPLAHATAGESGEFHLDFDFEPTVILVVGIAETQGITIPLPPLRRAG
jgi:CheY-like chemotaxis protein